MYNDLCFFFLVFCANLENSVASTLVVHGHLFNCCSVGDLHIPIR